MTAGERRRVQPLSLIRVHTVAVAGGQWRTARGLQGLLWIHSPSHRGPSPSCRPLESGWHCGIPQHE